MDTTTLPTSTSSSQLRAMTRLEARRFARHPMFLAGTVGAFAVLALMWGTEEGEFGDVMSTPVVAAFFIGLFSLLAAARLTRSTEVAGEAVGTAPGAEAVRTRALLGACLVPFAAGWVWLAALLLVVASRGVAAEEWWFATMSDLQLWAILVGLGPVACLGGAVLGVVTGRWLRFPGAPALVVLVTLVVCVGSMWPAQSSHSWARLVVPWAAFHSGTNADGSTTVFAGNAPFYLVYLLCLVAGAALVAVLHDRSARTPRLRAAVAGVTVVGLAALTLAMTTGPGDRTSAPDPEKAASAGVVVPVR